MQSEIKHSTISTDQICIELLDLAEAHERIIVSKLPSIDIHSITLFIESVRTYDLQSVMPSGDADDRSAIKDILRMGWNLATSYLLKPLEIVGFPMLRSSEENQEMSFLLMYNFGCCSQIKRTVDMIRAGILKVEKDGSSYTFRKSVISNNQYMDMLEYSFLNKIEKEIISGKERYKNWNIIQSDSQENPKHQHGSYIKLGKLNSFEGHLQDNVEELMLPLISTWSSGFGPIVSYESSPEIDAHFMAISSEMSLNWRVDAGLHPDVKIGSLQGSDLTWIIMLLTSFNLKHINFVQLAQKKYPDLLLPESLTIWKVTDELINDIIEFTKFDRNYVVEVLGLIIFNPDDATMLRKHSSLFMPLLISLGNGYLLRPISAITRNPFYTIISLLEQRDSNFRHQISVHREKWQRDELYAEFQGNRYQRMEGNVNLRLDGKVITDIDAAIFDNTNGELALFQIKWQDFFFNDVKKLRSKASNLARELDEWAEKVNLWVEKRGKQELGKLLRFKNPNEIQITSIYLFGLSRSACRTSTYGFDRKSFTLAITNWPQFRRNRIEIGPAKSVIGSLFYLLKDQEKVSFNSKPLLVKLQVQDKMMIFEDLWYTHSDEND